MGGDGYALVGYHNVEAVFALRLAADLKNAGVNLWFDRLDIRPEDDWSATVRSALQDCALFIPLLSPDYLASEYGRRELEQAARNHALILFVLVRSFNAGELLPPIPIHEYVDATDWRDDIVYEQALTTILARIEQSQRVAISSFINPEIRYLVQQAANVEMQKTALEYVRLSYQSSMQDDLTIRPAPALESDWGLGGLYIFRPFYRGEAQVVSDIYRVLEAHPRLVMLGDVGSGKTTTLHRLMLDGIRAYHAQARRVPLPFFVSLSQWQEDQTLTEFLEAHWPLRADVFDWLKRGWITLYLDDLDGMGAGGIRRVQQLRNWLHEPNGPRQVVIVCRSDAYTDTLDVGLPTLTVEALTAARLETIVTSQLGVGPAAVLWQKLEPSWQWEWLLRSPLLVRLLMFVYQHSPSAPLPTSPGRLILRYIELNWDREQILQNPDWVPLPDIIDQLSSLAFAVFERDLPRTLASEWISVHISDRNRSILQTACILTPQGRGLRFFHELMLDTLAAYHIMMQGWHHHMRQPLLDENGQRQPQNWDRVILALAGLYEPPSVIVRDVMEVDPFLAARCLIQGPATDDRLHEQVAQRLITFSVHSAPGSLAATQIILEDMLAGDLPAFLLGQMRTGDWATRSLAWRYLQSIDVTVSPETLNVLRSWDWGMNSQVIAALQPYPDEAVPALLRLLVDADWHRRRAAAWALGALADRAATIGLSEALRDAEAVVRREVAQSLRAVRDPDAVPHLLQSLRDPDAGVRKAVAQALGDVGTSAVPGLLRLLRDERDDVKRIALGVLGRVGDISAGPAIQGFLKEDNADLRAMAVAALGQLRDESAIGDIANLLSDEAIPRWSEQSIGLLALKALEQIGTEESMRWIKGWRERLQNIGAQAQASSATSARQRLKDITRQPVDPPASSLLSSALSHPQEIYRLQAVEKLGASGDPAILPALLERLRNDSATAVRVKTVQVLGHFVPEVSLPGLVEAFYDADPEVAAVAAVILHRIGDVAVPHFMAALKSERVDVRARAVDLLGEMQVADAAPALASLLTDTTATPSGATVADHVRQALTTIGTPYALSLLDRPAEDLTPADQVAIAIPTEFILLPEYEALDETMAGLDDEYDLVVPGELASPASEPASPVAQPVSQPMLTQAVADEDDIEPADRPEALPALVVAPEPVAVSVPGMPAPSVQPAAQNGIDADLEQVTALLAQMKDVSWNVRQEAAKHLNKLARRVKLAQRTGRAKPVLTHPAIMQALHKGLKDEDSLVRFASVEALAFLGDDSSIAHIVPLLRDAQWTTKVAAVRALAEIGAHSAVPSIAQCLNDAHDMVQEVAAESLGKIGTDEAGAALHKAFQASSGFLRRAIVDALGEVGYRAATPTLLKVLEEDDLQLRWSVVEALGKMGAIEAVPVLIQYLDKKDILPWEETPTYNLGDMAAQSLRQIGTPEAMQALESRSVKS